MNAYQMRDGHFYRIANAYLKTIGEYLDHDFYLITERKAKELCKPAGLPRHGYERIVAVDKILYIVARTPHQNKMRWSIRYYKPEAIIQ